MRVHGFRIYRGHGGLETKAPKAPQLVSGAAGVLKEKTGQTPGPTENHTRTGQARCPPGRSRLDRRDVIVIEHNPVPTYFLRGSSASFQVKGIKCKIHALFSLNKSLQNLRINSICSIWPLIFKSSALSVYNLH